MPTASVEEDVTPSTSNSLAQPKLDEMSGFKAKMSKFTHEKLTNNLARWIAADYRPILVVEDKGLKRVLQTASQDPTYKMITTKIGNLYDTGKEEFQTILKKAEFVALTGDPWTSLSNSNFLGVTSHFIDTKWHLQSFALTTQKTTTRHFADNVADDFDSVAEDWQIKDKVTTLGTDAARTIVAAMRRLTFKHMLCVAHALQRTITVCLEGSGFTDTMAKYVTEVLGGETYVSCSVVLPALRHVMKTIEISDDDPAYVARFKAAFTKDLSQPQDGLNTQWLRTAAALDPCF
ncbi:uncharacterized protein V6R79_013886 [Siganus canaliculatus]